MDTYTRRYKDLNRAVRSIHEMFAEWEEWPERNAPELFCKRPKLLYRARLALHEWLANLSQHAEFQGRNPSVLITITSSDGTFTCSIRDNSEGFDLENHSTGHEDIFSVFPERGMGLELMRHCTTNVHYEEIDEGFNLLTFTINASQRDA